MSNIADEYDDFVGKVNEDEMPVTLFDDESIIPETAEEAAHRMKWERLWKGMPAYESEEQSAFRTLIVNFATEEAFDDFCQKLGLVGHITSKTKTTFYPPKKTEELNKLCWVDENDV